ncbi:MAG: hypothetical protein RIS47_2269 [Bacteroidota bacterium]
MLPVDFVPEREDYKRIAGSSPYKYCWVTAPYLYFFLFVRVVLLKMICARFIRTCCVCLLFGKPSCKNYNIQLFTVLISLQLQDFQWLNTAINKLLISIKLLLSAHETR